MHATQIVLKQRMHNIIKWSVIDNTYVLKNDLCWKMYSKYLQKPLRYSCFSKLHACMAFVAV